MSPTTAPPDEPPALPHERQITTLLRNADEAAWKIPSALTARLPFATFALGIDRASPKAPATLVLQTTLPCPPPTTEECARYRLLPGIPRYALTVPEDCWSGSITVALTQGVTLSPDDALALLAGENFTDLATKAPPNGRPFTVTWLTALANLATATMHMHWQGLALRYDRHAVHRVRAAVREHALSLHGAWGQPLTGEVR